MIWSTKQEPSMASISPISRATAAEAPFAVDDQFIITAQLGSDRMKLTILFEKLQTRNSKTME